MENTDVSFLIEQALKARHFRSATKLASEIEDVAERESWYEQILCAQESVQADEESPDEAAHSSDRLTVGIHRRRLSRPKAIYYVL